MKFTGPATVVERAEGREERGVGMLKFFDLDDWVNVSTTHKGRDNRRESLLWGKDRFALAFLYLRCRWSSLR